MRNNVDSIIPDIEEKLLTMIRLNIHRNISVKRKCAICIIPLLTMIRINMQRNLTVSLDCSIKKVVDHDPHQHALQLLLKSKVPTLELCVVDHDPPQHASQQDKPFPNFGKSVLLLTMIRINMHRNQTGYADFHKLWKCC